MTCQIIKQRNLSNRDAIKVEEKEGKWDFLTAFWYSVGCWKKKRMLSVDAPTAEMALDCNSLNKKGIFLICTAIQAR